MSVRGIRVRYFALALGVIAVIAGVYFTFFQSRGFSKTTATIVSVKELPRDFENEDVQYEVMVEYTVNGQQYTQQLDSSSGSDKAGKTIQILYNPDNPSVIHRGGGFGLYILIAGAVILVIAIISIISGRMSLKKLKEKQKVGKEAEYAPSVLGAERELYFLTDLGTPKYGHRIEDANRKVLIEAKMTKFTVTTPFEFDFINYESGQTTSHLVGHEEATEWGTLLLDNNYTFKFDGEDIWKHLREHGISVKSGFGSGSGKLIGVNYTIFRNNLEIARVESTSQHVHEEDAAAHSVASKIPVQGFFRIWTKDQNLDLLFLTLLAFARTQASDDRGGNYKTIFGTFEG